MKVVRSHASGYTILESMIFLAVTGALFGMVAVTIQGQQQRAEFNQGVRDLESRVQDIMNDVATGYYTNTGTFRCSALPSDPTPNIVAGSNNQGANLGCIFLGRAIQFGAHNSNRRDYTVFTVVGKQRVPGGVSPKEVNNYGEAAPTVARFANEQERIGGGISVAWVRSYHGGALMNNLGTVGFFSSLGKYEDTALSSGSNQLDLVPIPGSTLDDTPDGAANDIDSLRTTVPTHTTPPVNVDGGVVVCLQNNGRAQHALLKIGGGNRRQATNVEFVEGDCP